jgi:hypothetical protein
MAREVQFGVRLTGDAKGAVNAMRLTDKELGKLRRELDRTDRRVSRHRQGLQGWAQSLTGITRLLAPLAGIAGVSMLARTTRNVIEQTAAISEAADMAGITAERYQELTKAFSDLGGVTEEQTNGALLRFNRRLGLAADGAGPAKDAFRQMGVELRDVSGNLRGTEDALADVIRALAGIQNDAERAARASAFFGDRSGPQLAAVLGQGEDAINAQIEALREHGRVLDNETVASARRANDELNALRDIISTRFRAAILEHAEAYTALARALAGVAGFGLDAAAAIGRVFEELHRSRTAPGILDELEKVQSRLDKVRERLSRTDSQRQPGLFADLVELEANLNTRARELEERLLSRPDFEPLEVTIPFKPDFVEADDTGSPRITASGSTPVDRFPAQFQSLADRLDPVSAATRQYMVDVTMLDEAWARGLISGEGYWDLLNRLATGEAIEGAAEELQDIVESTKEINDLGASLGMSFASGFEEAIVSGNSFRDVLQGIFDDLLRIATRTLITAPLADAAGAFFSGMFPGRATGGPVSVGSGYIVGERGPELFVPRMSGGIVPNHALGGSNVQVNVINNVGANVTTRERQTPQGPAIDVMIDMAVAEKLSQRGSASNQAMRSTFGARPVLAGR